MAENIHNIDFKWLLEALAEGEGFEPSIRLPAYTLSKRAPSTTRPPLLGGGH